MKRVVAVVLLLCVLLFTLAGCYSARDLDLARAAGYAAGVEDAERDAAAPTPRPTVRAESSGGDGVTVCVARTGEKYHSLGCQYLSQSCIAIDLDDAVSQGYTPCSRCDPPE